MVWNPYYEAESPSAGQTSSCLLWNPRVNYHVQKEPPMVPLMSQINPIYTMKHNFPYLHFNYPFIYSKVSQAVSSLQIFQLKCWYFPSPTCAAHLIPLNLITVIFGEEYKLQAPRYTIFCIFC